MSTPPPGAIYLIDGTGIAYRAFFAFIRNPLYTSRGLNTSAVFGVARWLTSLVRNRKPARIVCALDGPAKTFRHLEHPTYKATREKMPDEMADQLPLIDRLIAGFRLPVVIAAGFEADDVIGTLATRAASQGDEVFIISGDKDFAQLVGDRVRLLDPFPGSGPEVLGREEIQARWGVPPERILDAFALAGDASDNVPGIPGIGPKRAAQLIGSRGTLEAVLGDPSAVPWPSIRKAVAEYGDVARTARDLIRIRTDVPLPDGLLDAPWPGPDVAALEALFIELEFKSLASDIRSLGAGTGSPPPPTAEATPVGEETGGAAQPADAAEPLEDFPEIPTAVVDSDEDLGRLLSAIDVAPAVALHGVYRRPEGQGPRAERLAGLALAVAPDRAFYLPADRDVQALNTGGLPLRYARGPCPGPPGLGTSGPCPEPLPGALRPAALGGQCAGQYLPGEAVPRQRLLFDDGSAGGPEPRLRARVQAVAARLARAGFGAADSKRLLHALEREGAPTPPIAFDPLLAAYLLDPSGRAPDLGELTARILRRRLPADTAGKAAAATLLVHRALAAEVERLGMERLYREVELPLAGVLARMETAGVAIDIPHLEAVKRTLGERSAALAREIEQSIGHPANIASPKQLSLVLFGEMKIHEAAGRRPPRRTHTGFSTSQEVLDSYASHPLVAKILRYRSLEKLLGTYVEVLPRLLDPETGLLHTTFNQVATATGRLSSSDPNLQNIPIRSEDGKEIRRAFLPRAPGRVLLSADYSQIELRILAHIAADASLRDAFLAGDDIHRATAARVFKLPLESVGPAERSRAKAINYGVVYGMGPRRLAQETALDETEAKAFIDLYFKTFPGVRAYIDRTIAHARETGAVETLLGRRRLLPEIHSRRSGERALAERLAINTPIQGSAADLIKVAMVRIDRRLAAARSGSLLILQVHDELLLDVPESEREAVAALVREEMEQALRLDVPIRVDIGWGRNWLEAHG